MRKKLKRSELQRNVNIVVTPRKRFKDYCDDCLTYKYDVHSYFDEEGTVYILCPECMKKNKKIIKNWKGEPIEREENNDKDESSKKKRTKQSGSKNNKNSSNTENGSEDSGQLLHGGISRRKRSAEQSEHQSRRRKSKTI